MLDSKQAPQAFILSKTLRAIGHELTERQAIILDVAQVIHQKFMKRTAVSVKMIIRVATHYHGISGADTDAVIEELKASGLLVEFTTDQDLKRCVKLTIKLKGLAADEVTEETAGLGYVEPQKLPLPSLRDRCESAEFRRMFSQRFNWHPETICTVEAAMVLTAINERAGVDQVNFERLADFCISNGMTDREFRNACDELHALGAIEFYRTGTQMVMVRMTLPADRATKLKPCEALETLAV